MTASTARRLVGLLAIVLAIAACNREQPAPEATPEAPAAETASAEPAPAEPAKIPGTDAIAAVDNAPAEAGVQPAGGFDAKAFASVYAAEGIGIDFKADGTYAMTVHAASADADLKSTGTWTVDASGKQLVLDSDDKSEADRRYELVSWDELKALDGGQVLRRESAH